MHNVYRVCEINLDYGATFTFRNYGANTVNVFRAYEGDTPKEIECLTSYGIVDTDDESYARFCADWLICADMGDIFPDFYDGTDRLSIWIDHSTALHVEHTAECDDRGAARFAYSVDYNGETIMQGNDLCVFTESLYRAMATFVSFLSHYGEVVEHARRNGTPTDDLRTEEVTFGVLVADGMIDLDEISAWSYSTEEILNGLDLR